MAEKVTFCTIDREAEIISALDRIDLPEGIDIRPIQDADREAFSSLETGVLDQVQPSYGTRSPEQEGLALLAWEGQTLAGHISCHLSVFGLGRDAIDIEISVANVFVDASFRGRGIGKALGMAAVNVTEDWRRDIARNRGIGMEGWIDIVGDTFSEPSGESIISAMNERAMKICDPARDEDCLPD